MATIILALDLRATTNLLFGFFQKQQLAGFYKTRLK
jgi:hypothetical protein